MKLWLGRLFTACVTTLGLLCATVDISAANELSGYHHHGDRMAGHGMAVFGEHRHYLAHIPVFGRPHNEQLISLVKFEDGQGNTIQFNFSSGPHSLVPLNSFSLDNLVLTKGMTFQANIHKGNFEHDGPLLLTAVTVRVEQILVARNLPVAEQDTRDAAAENIQEYYLFGVPGDVYLANYIRSNRPFQQILKVAEVSGAPSLSADQAIRMTTVTASRLTPTNATVFADLPKAGTSETTPIQFKLASELWCLKGPNFVSPCAPLNLQ
jgi:hypothetical protein